MSTEVTYIRSEDLLDDSEPQRKAPRFGPAWRRQAGGLILAIVALPLLTLFLDAIRSELALDGQVLLYLLVVVAISIVGGPLVATMAAVAAALLINYFFVDPLYTLRVADPDQVVALLVFVIVGVLVSGAVELFSGALVPPSRPAGKPRRSRGWRAQISAARNPSGTFCAMRGHIRHGVRGADGARARSRHLADVGHAGGRLAGRRRPFGSTFPPDRTSAWSGGARALRGGRTRPGGVRAAARTAYEGRVLSDEAEQGRTLATVDEQRTALLAAVGHDLRTPLASVKAAVGTLRQTDVEWSGDERAELLQTIEDSADRLDGVVSNLLDASRLQAGALTVTSEPVALDGVVAAAVLGLSGRERVLIEVPEDLPYVRADRGLLERVLANVLDNALRHGGSERPVEVRAHAVGSSARVEISDHGAGVPEDARARLFEPFERLDGQDTYGLGLGLSVARGFVEAMGGALVADDTPGGGLTMRIRLELAG